MDRRSSREVDWREDAPRPFTRSWWRRLAACFHLAGRDFVIDNGFHWAAAVAFYALLSALPLLIAVISLVSHFTDPAWAAEQLTGRMEGLLPGGEEEVRDTVVEALEAGGGVGFWTLMVLLWSGSNVFAAMTTALNMAYDVDEVYGFWKLMMIRFLMLVTVGLFFALAVLSRPLLAWGYRAVGEAGADTGRVQEALGVVVPFVLLTLAFFAVYRFVPRTRPRWQPALLGAVLAAVSFMIARPLFLHYLQEVGGYGAIYGPLALAVILLFWAWIVAVILILGGEIASVIQSVMVEGMSMEEVERHHLERSPQKERDGRGS